MLFDIMWKTAVVASVVLAMLTLLMAITDAKDWPDGGTTVVVCFLISMVVIAMAVIGAVICA